MHVPPPSELERSVAARTVGRLAGESGVGMFHFEHRRRLDTPEHWLPQGRADLVTPPDWVAGVLPESKYQAFRHDLLVGSFHPGHRAKWTTHELCHGLVGFAWHPDASPFFHALAARLAEALPVGLWYFLDESGLQRCAAHAGGGPLHGSFCGACEEAALEGVDPEAVDRAWHTLGAGFVEREIDAVLRSAREGVMISHRHGALDLASDGLAYVGAHGSRLAAPEFARFVDGFFRSGEGHHLDLESLAARVQEVLEAILADGTIAPLEGGREVRMAQDVAWRLLTVRAETFGEAGDLLDPIVDGLAEDRSLDGLTKTIEAYKELHDAFELPEPADVFAVGYDLPLGMGRSVDQIHRGLESASPRVMARLEGEALDVTRAFLATDGLERAPLGRRFARWAAGSLEPPLMDLAALEASLAHPAPPDPEATALARGAYAPTSRLDRSVELLCLGYDVLDEPEGPYVALERSLNLAIRSLGDGDVDLVDLQADVFDTLAGLGDGPIDTAELGLDDATLSALFAHGILVPERWSLEAAGPFEG